MDGGTPIAGAQLRGPLAPEMYDTARPVPGWWQASLAPEAPRPRLEGEAEAEIAIIGGGFAGLNAALALARAGRAVAVLDAGAIGWGASGRNGGIVGLGGHKLSDRALDRRHGREERRRLEAAQAEAVRWVRRFCEAEGLGHLLSGAGEVLWAHSPSVARGLAAMAKAPPEGTEVAPVAPSGRDDIARHGGVRVSPGFGIHPLGYVRALARAAERAGARICESSAVTGWTREGARHRLHTAFGTLRAEQVLIATNGFTPDGLTPRLEGRAVPVISNIAVTRPLGEEERAHHPWLDDDPACCTRNMLSYFRLVRPPTEPEAAPRLLLGIRGDLTGADANEPEMRERVAARIGADLPGLRGVEIDHFWRGPVCATFRFAPSVGWLDRERRVAVALGWHGSGVAMGSYGGRLAAELIASGTDGHIPAAMRGPSPRVPFPGLRPAYVGLMTAWYALHDRLTGARPGP